MFEVTVNTAHRSAKGRNGYFYADSVEVRCYAVGRNPCADLPESKEAPIMVGITAPRCNWPPPAYVVLSRDEAHALAAVLTAAAEYEEEITE
jgi:hypothetical protein